MHLGCGGSLSARKGRARRWARGFFVSNSFRGDGMTDGASRATSLMWTGAPNLCKLNIGLARFLRTLTASLFQGAESLLLGGSGRFSGQRATGWIYDHLLASA